MELTGRQRGLLQAAVDRAIRDHEEGIERLERSLTTMVRKQRLEDAARLEAIHEKRKQALTDYLELRYLLTKRGR